MARALRMTFVGVVALVAACKADKPEKTPAPATGSAPAPGPAAPVPAAPAAQPAAPALPGQDDLCRSPAMACLMLATTTVEQASEAWCKACAGSKWLDGGKCDGKWLTAAERTDGDYDYARNCVYASRGYTFKKKEWRQRFGAEAWYKPRADFKDAELSAIENKNIAALKAMAAAVRERRAQDASVTPAEQKLVEGWLKSLAAGSPKLPAKLTLHGLAVGKDEFLKSAKEAQLNLKTLSGTSDGGGRVLWVSDASPSPGCEDEDCEGFWSIRFDLDAKGHVTAIALDAAACPFVYVAGAGGLVKQGEILRNLRHPGLEGSRRLSLGAAGCGGRIASRLAVRIAEEKLETTHLDAVSLELGDRVIRPAACDDAPAPAYCHDDGRYHALAPGETLDLEFAIPAGSTCAAPALVADGYYLPR